MATDDSRLAAFGPNEWLVDEIYEQFLQDRNSVDAAWWDFFEGYAPADHSPVAAPVLQVADVARPSEPAASAHPLNGHPLNSQPSPPAAPTVLKGPAARVVGNMEESLTVPTATSVRAVPAKLLMDNRIVINNHLARGRGGKVSFTHLIGWAVVRAATEIYT